MWEKNPRKNVNVVLSLLDNDADVNVYSRAVIAFHTVRVYPVHGLV